MISPALVTLVFMSVLVTAVIAVEGGGALALARLGTRYALGDKAGSDGYDGQFVYYIARDPDPAHVMKHLDVPPYRYQRILLPLAARLLAWGDEHRIPWVLVLINILAQAVGTWCVGELLAGWGISRWYALSYGLWAGFSLAVRLDLPEPLAYAFIAAGLMAGERKRFILSWLFYALALFSKEVTILFIAAQLGTDLAQKRWGYLIIGLCAVLLYALFQGWLWFVFGQPGISSGGAMATPFEIIPFMGLFRIGYYDFPYFLAMLLVFGLSVVLPTIWGLWAGAKKWLTGERSVIALALLINAMAIVFLPFSTFRETGGLLRFACGLVLTVVLFAGKYHYRRVLNYSPFWIVLNVFLLKS